MRDYGERLLQLERQLYDLQTEVNAARQRMVSQAATPSVRPAKIATAPTSGSDKKFGVVFLDGTFDEVIGAGDATFTDRQNSYKHVAYNLGGTQPAIGDKVFCYWASGRWWFAKGDGGSGPVTIEGAAINIFSGPKAYYTLGPSVGMLADTGAIGFYKDSYRYQFDIAWQNQVGEDIGIAITDSSGYAMTTSEVGIYRFTMHGYIERNYYAAPPVPDPAILYSWQMKLENTPGDSADITNGDEFVHVELSTVTSGGSIGFTDENGTPREGLAVNQTIFGQAVRKTSLPTTWRFRATLFNTGDPENFGARLFTPVLTVERLA